METKGKYAQAEREFLEDLAKKVTASQLSFADAVNRAVAHLGRSEKGVALYLGRLTRKVAGTATRRRRAARMPSADAKPADIVRVIQSLSQEYKTLTGQRDALTKRIDEVEEKLSVLKDRLLSGLGIKDQ